MLRHTILAALTFLSFQPTFGQSSFHPDSMETILYGAAYYPEYMPYERLDKDVELMKQAGISVVRMGESSWGLWEPEDGRFEYAWMDRAVSAMQKAGIKVIMGTPTYSIPRMDVQEASRDCDDAARWPNDHVWSCARMPTF